MERVHNLALLEEKKLRRCCFAPRSTNARLMTNVKLLSFLLLPCLSCSLVNNATLPSVVSSFCVVADTPYTEKEEIKLKNQIQFEIPDECSFLLHLGDIRGGKSPVECSYEAFQNVAEIMKLSPVPVFMLLGEFLSIPHRTFLLLFYM